MGMAYQNSALLSLQMRIGEHDATNLRTLDVSPNGLHASFSANVPVKISGQRGYTFLYANARYMTGATRGLFNQARFTVGILFSPTFALTDGNNHLLLDTDDPRYSVVWSTDTNIYIYLGGTLIFTLAIATYSPYWKLNQYNTLIVSGTSGSNFVWMNGVQLGTNATAWAAGNPTTYIVGNRFGGVQYWTGNMYQFEAYPLNLTQIQATDWHFNAMRRLNDV